MAKIDVLLVTGAGGFLGSRLVPLLTREAEGAQIIAVVRDQKAVDRLGGALRVVRGDLRDRMVWSRLPKNITRVFHLAAAIPWKGSAGDRADIAIDNLVPLTYLIESARKWDDLKQVVYSSSISVYAQAKEILSEDDSPAPADIYGAAKLAGEKLLLCLESRGVRVASLRYSSLYGRGQYQGTVLPIMVKFAADGKDLPVFGDGGRTQDFLECGDAARANLLAYGKNAKGVYNIGSGTPVTMKNLALKISEIFSGGRSKTVCHCDNPEAEPGYRIDISKAALELEYRPEHQIDSGLRKLREEMQKCVGARK